MRFHHKRSAFIVHLRLCSILFFAPCFSFRISQTQVNFSPQIRHVRRCTFAFYQLLSDCFFCNRVKGRNALRSIFQKMVILDACFSIMTLDLAQLFIVHCDFHVHLGQIRQHDGIGGMVQVVFAAFLIRAPGILSQPFFSEAAGNMSSDAKHSGLFPGKLQMVFDESHYILGDIASVIDISGFPSCKDSLGFLSVQCRKHQIIIFLVADRVTRSSLFCFDTFNKCCFLFSCQIHQWCLLSFCLIFVSADKGFIHKRIIQN